MGLKGSTENIEEEPKPTNDENERTFFPPQKKFFPFLGAFFFFLSKSKTGSAA